MFYDYHTFGYVASSTREDSTPNFKQLVNGIDLKVLF